MNAIRIRRRTQRGGFTLVEILIVVIILGILAAIVIPQFTNASQDARKNSLTSQLQTIRSQLELYKLQHLDQLPPALVAAGGAGSSPACWAELCEKTNADHSTTGTPQFGPYLQAAPMNPLNNVSDVAVVSGTTDYGTGGVANGNGTVGFVLNSTTGKIWATSAQFGFIYNEGSASDPQNDQ
jgi:general secretion pathway protein G